MPKQGLEYLNSEDKRRLDLIGAIALAGVLAPVAAGVGASIALKERSPQPIFMQERLGGRGEDSFKVWKFRTLSRAISNQAFSQSYGTFDPRATKFGLTLRQSGLDEIPQLINVLKGEMSLVGCRPVPPSDLERNQAADPYLFEEWYEYFKVVKPGLTGKSQIYRHHYRHNPLDIIRNSMRMDLDYFETATLRGDVKWMAQTPARLLEANLNVVENDFEPFRNEESGVNAKSVHQVELNNRNR